MPERLSGDYLDAMAKCNVLKRKKATLLQNQPKRHYYRRP